MKLSISNLAWASAPLKQIAVPLRQAGIRGVEIAPTMVWPDAPFVESMVIVEFGQAWRDYGLEISGIQSLMFGHPEYNLFSQETWPQMLNHMRAMIRVARGLGCGIAVFGSPKNRIRGSLPLELAHEIAATFMNKLIPELTDNEVILTLEPNAPVYGADYLTHYADILYLTDLIASQWVQPQIDTGCLSMVHENSADAARIRTPAHVHISAPHLAPPPIVSDHESLKDELTSASYAGWIVLEMLSTPTQPVESAVSAARWLKSMYGE